MDKQYCNTIQTLTLKLFPALAVLCLVSVAVLTPAVTLSTAQAQRSQLQTTEPTQVPAQTGTVRPFLCKPSMQYGMNTAKVT